ncbi:SWI-SNF complex subunit [Pyrenophora tritici-repentis]|nr:SWI-SNF complex subunit [Pyrenophora tritici-repentis]
MASSSGLTRRRGGGGGAAGNGEDESSRVGSPAPKRNDDRTPETSYESSENGHKIAFDPRDISENAERSKQPKLTLMEEIILMGLKDKQGYLSFWNDNISYALRGCIVIELAFRGRVSMQKDSSRRRFPLADRNIEVIDDTLTGEVLLDEALKMMKSSEKMSVNSWIDLMSGETWNLMKIGYQLKQVRERLCKGLVDKGILRTEKKNFLLFDMATHPVADGGAKEEIRRRVRNVLTNRTVVLPGSQFLPEELDFRVLRTITMVCAAYAANVLENALTTLGHEARERAFAQVDELLAEYSQWPFAKRQGGSQGVGANLGQLITDEVNNNKDKELQLEVAPAARIRDTHAMPSPPLADTQALDSSHGASTNGISGEGAVQPANAPTSLNGSDTASAENNAIRDGKQKAKAVMVASGLNLAGAQSDTASPAHPEAINGASPSRKRSRSGTRKSSHSPSQEGAARPTASQTHLLNRYIARDLLDSVNKYERNKHSEKVYGELNDLRHFYRDEVYPVRRQNPGAIFGYGYAGYGNGLTDIPPDPRDPRAMPQTKLLYPEHAKRAGRRLAPQLKVSKEKGLQQAEQIEELVPIRLDIELDRLKLRDTFTWNLHDRVTNPVLFAQTLVEDFQIPPELRQNVMQQIDREIHEQVQDYYPHAFFDDEPLDPHQPYSAYKNDEMRILIKLNITIGQHTLVDQFEWEINNPLNAPEDFARQMAADLSLSGEFTTAIAHSIREQCQMFTKSLYITGHPFDGRPVEDTDIQDNFLASPLPTVFRPMQSTKDYQPYLYELSNADLERAELSIMREQRRQKRSVNRRGGPALPDLKDRQRTVRTLVVSSVLPGAAESIEDSQLFKATRKVREGRRRGAEGSSDESDSDDSVMESPAPAQLTGGTARTRGMRGAATAAQAAMRSAIGRSATPEVSTLQTHHEPRASRSLRYEAREESVTEPTTFIVKLRISSAKLREFQRNPKAFAKSASTPMMAPSQTPARSTPTANSMPPPPSPAMPPRSTPAAASEASPRPPTTPTPTASNKQLQYKPDGSMEAAWPAPPVAQHPPPPPWLQQGLQELRDRNPGELFESTMRYAVMNEQYEDPKTGVISSKPVKIDTIAPNAPLPANYKAYFLPRIRCMDCPGKLYNAGPEQTVNNFELHLKNRIHMEN